MEVKTINGYDIKDETARNNLNKLKTNKDFYDLKYYTERHNNTDCYIVEIPTNDLEGNEINFYTGYSQNLSPNEYAIENNTSLTVNSSLSSGDEYEYYSNIIGNGEILVNNAQGISQDTKYIGIKANRVIELYNNGTTAQQMINDGVLQSAVIWGQTAINGVYNDLGVGDTLSPRTMLGVKSDKTFIILCCDGRTYLNNGLTFEQATEILLDKECLDVYALDGGGSTSLSINGLKVNRNIDDNGLTDRQMKVTFNVKKETNNKGVAESNSSQGKLKQNILSQILPLINNLGSNLYTPDLNECYDKMYFSFVTHATNCPSNEDGTGYFINIAHYGVDSGNSYSLQYYIEYRNSRMYKRQYDNGTYSNWESILGNKFYGIFNSSTNITISGDDTYENCYFKEFQSNGTRIVVDEESNVFDTNYYDKIKITKTGVYKITAQVTFNSHNDGAKSIQISKNNTSSSFNVCSQYIENGNYGSVETFTVQEFNANDYIYVKVRGLTGDKVVRARVSVEEF